MMGRHIINRLQPKRFNAEPMARGMSDLVATSAMVAAHLG